MAKKNEPEVTEQKVQTRYDKKMAARSMGHIGRGYKRPPCIIKPCAYTT